jgi:hypothetical protein
MTAGPAIWMAAADPSSSPVPIDPPTPTMAIWPAPSWRRSPLSADSGLLAVPTPELYQKPPRRVI